jgi:hypothetical protein
MDIDLVRRGDTESMSKSESMGARSQLERSKSKKNVLDRYVKR